MQVFKLGIWIQSYASYIHTKTLEVQLGRASRTQETGGENVRGQRSDPGFKVPSCELIGVLRGWGFREFKVYGVGL